MAPRHLRVACVQVCASDNAEDNVLRTLAQIRLAAQAGAQFVALPEAVDYLDADFERTRAYARPESSHAALAAFSAIAKSLRLWLLVGSLTVRDDDGELVNRSFLLSPQGETVCRYDKIHLFDALPGSSSFTESRLYKRGQHARVYDTPWGALGLSICYDVRFPHLFRGLAQAGASMIAMPAAFMKVTGEAHWHVLVRARAIETGCFVIAPAQCGHHYGERYSFGHSLIVDPWGTVLADGGESPGFVMADLDLGLVAQARTRIPSLHQDREVVWGAQA
ncbi:hypothetical protein A9762_14095 [Pandoraea sp. ISTKB]|nr:hypothetical protein A9762_14095 [Pandoraea sp. ISTKB]